MDIINKNYLIAIVLETYKINGTEEKKSSDFVVFTVRFVYVYLYSYIRPSTYMKTCYSRRINDLLAKVCRYYDLNRL